MASSGLILKAGGPTLLETTKPFANGGDGGGEQLRGAFDSALLRALHQPQAMVVGVAHLTHQIEIPSGGGHRDRILHGARGPAPPPSAGPRAPTPKANPIPSPASDSRTSISPGGYDVSRLSQARIRLAQAKKLQYAD